MGVLKIIDIPRKTSLFVLLVLIGGEAALFMVFLFKFFSSATMVTLMENSLSNILTFVSSQIEGIKMIDWNFALKMLYSGPGAVFISLVILLGAACIFGKSILKIIDVLRKTSLSVLLVLIVGEAALFMVFLFKFFSSATMVTLMENSLSNILTFISSQIEGIKMIEWSLALKIFSYGLIAVSASLGILLGVVYAFGVFGKILKEKEV